ncbi:MAG: hypothetical protein JWP97_511 [Labilithrix sp.]|nr:hypothetical protein [Labilithrix sp.]
MKTLAIATISFAAAVSTLSGCSFAARSPDMYRDDTKAVLETKSNDIRACYDGVLKGTPGAQGKVTVKFNVETEAGKFTNIAVDKANTTAPAAVSDCVVRTINGLGIAPPDKHEGDATFVWEFSAPAAPSAPGAAAPRT